MQKYKVIVSDLGNVLIPFDYDIMLRKIEAVEKGLGDRFQQRYKENYDVHRKYEAGEINQEEFLKTMDEWLEHKIDTEEFLHIFSDIFTLNDKVIELLEKLKPHYRLMLLSNTNAIHQKYGWSKYTFLDMFEKKFLSHEVGAVKPEAKIYKAVQQYTGALPEEHLFIDDVNDYVQGAKNVGWDAVQYTDYDRLVADLKARGIKMD